MKFQHPTVARAIALQARFYAHAPKVAPTAQIETMKLTFPIAQTIEILSDHVERNADIAAEVVLAKLESSEALAHSDNEPLSRLGLAEWEALPEIESTPASQLDVEILAAEQEYLEYDALLSANPREYCADAAERAADLYANWQCLLAYQAKAVPSFTVTTQPHPDHGKRGTITVRNFSDRADAEAYAAFFGRSIIVARDIVPCAECGGHGCDGPKRIHWSNPNNIAMRCGRCGGDGEEPEIEDYDEENYPDNDPSL